MVKNLIILPEAEQDVNLGDKIMKLHVKKLINNVSREYSKRPAPLGFNKFRNRTALIAKTINEDLAMTKNFLDFLWHDSKNNPENLVPYTSEMSARISALTEGVDID